MNMKKSPSVAIVIPHVKNQLMRSEKISVEHWKKYLSKYDTYTVSPPGISPPDKNMKVKTFDVGNFTSVKSYSRLLLTPEFYQAFKTYEYILIYQLDALVFSDQLAFW